MGRGESLPTRFLRAKQNRKLKKARGRKRASLARGDVMPGAKGRCRKNRVLETGLIVHDEE